MLKIEKLHYYVVTFRGQEETLTPAEYAELYNDFMIMPEPEVPTKDMEPIDAHISLHTIDPGINLTTVENGFKEDVARKKGTKLFHCLDCGYEEEFPQYTSDGKRCRKCNSGLFMPVTDKKIMGVDLSTESDCTGYALPPLTQEDINETKIYNPKTLEAEETTQEEDVTEVPDAKTDEHVGDTVTPWPVDAVGTPKAHRKWKEEDFKKYIDLGVNGMSRTELVDRMVLDLELGQSTAYALYNKWIRNPVAYHKGVKERHDVVSRIHQEEVASMPEYKSIKEFKNAVCERQHLNLYDVTTLKEVYLNNHKEVRW